MIQNLRKRILKLKMMMIHKVKKMIQMMIQKRMMTVLVTVRKRKARRKSRDKRKKLGNKRLRKSKTLKLPKRKTQTTSKN